MSDQKRLTRAEAQAFMRELTELSRKHGAWIYHHHECAIAGKGGAGYSWDFDEEWGSIGFEATKDPGAVSPPEGE